MGVFVTFGGISQYLAKFKINFFLVLNVHMWYNKGDGFSVPFILPVIFGVGGAYLLSCMIKECMPSEFLIT